MIDQSDCGAIGGMKIGRGNRSTRRKSAPVPFSPPQIPHDQTRARKRAAAVGIQRLTAWAMARPTLHLATISDSGDNKLANKFHTRLYLTIELTNNKEYFGKVESPWTTSYQRRRRREVCADANALISTQWDWVNGCRMSWTSWPSELYSLLTFLKQSQVLALRELILWKQNHFKSYRCSTHRAPVDVQSTIWITFRSYLAVKTISTKPFYESNLSSPTHHRHEIPKG
jgi:hypothetical protein